MADVLDLRTRKPWSPPRAVLKAVETPLTYRHCAGTILKRNGRGGMDPIPEAHALERRAFWEGRAGALYHEGRIADAKDAARFWRELTDAIDQLDNHRLAVWGPKRTAEAQAKRVNNNQGAA